MTKIKNSNILKNDDSLLFDFQKDSLDWALNTPASIPLYSYTPTLPQVFAAANRLLDTYTYDQLLVIAIELNLDMRGIDYRANCLPHSLAWLIACHENGVKL